MEDRQPNGSWFTVHEQSKGRSSKGQLHRGSEKDCINDTSSCPTSKEMVASSRQSNVVACLDSTGVSRMLENCEEGSKNQGKVFLCEPESALQYPDASCVKPKFCDRNGVGLSDERPLFGMQGESFKQEVREQKISQWILKHNFSNEYLPSDCWPDKYPQASHEIPKSVQQSEYDKHEGNEVSQQFPRTKFHFSDPQKASSAKFNLLQHHLVSMGVSTDSGVLDTSRSAVAKKRKVECLKEEESKSMTIHKQSELAPVLKEWYSDNVQAGRICTLRQWLNRPSRVVDRCECVHIFKQILSLVHLAHMQGVILGNVRPSSFTLSSTHQVSFLDSASIESVSDSIDASTSGASLQTSLRDSRIVQNYIAAPSKREALSSKQATPPDTRKVQTLENDLEAFKSNSVNKRHILPLNMLNMSAKKESDNLDFEEYLAGQSRKSSSSSQKNGNCGMKPLYDDSRDSTDAPDRNSKSKDKLEVRERALKGGSMCDLVQLDEHCSAHSVCTVETRWYVSPEEVSGATCSFASNIYCLGVLFFELFCSSSTLEEYSEIMLDLRQRIMPSGMLTNRPKEAAFCLWLLHPNPNSRPRASELLHSEILNEVSEALEETQAAANVEEVEAQTELLLDFLKEVHRQKRSLLNILVKDVSCLTSDIQEVERRRSLLKHNGIICNGPQDNQALSSKLIEQEGNDRNLPSKTIRALNGQISEASVHGLNTRFCRKGIDVGKESLQRPEGLHSKCARLMNNFNQLEQVYLAMRSKFHSSLANSSTCCMENQNHNIASASSAPIKPLADLDLQNLSVVTQNSDYLGYFFDSISKYAKYSKFEARAVVWHRDLLKSSNMICALGFDRDQEYFAAAGVCKRIKVFDCDAILNDSIDIHYPVMEMISESILSSICWNSYIKGHIASSDYDGIVQLWDATTGQSLMQFGEHEKRAWSVDFSQADPKKLASGSDDGSVKLWSINQASSIGTIKINANVCCLQFSRDFGHLIAFGSADHKIYCYDLRSTGLPWRVLAGHQKAVSYVKFLNDNMLVSASTDSTLKLWDVSQTQSAGGMPQTSLLSYIGHTNEKNFVGLDVMDGYIACGSETNAVFAYHKSLPMPMASHKFGSVDPIIGQESEDATGQFVSSVCWRGKSQTLLVGNSMGDIKVLEMV